MEVCNIWTYTHTQRLSLLGLNCPLQGHKQQSRVQQQSACLLAKKNNKNKIILNYFPTIVTKYHQSFLCKG